MVIELYRLQCPDCIKAEKVEHLPSKAPYSKLALRQMGVDDIYLGKKQKFLTVVSNLETGEPLWFGRERKKETLDEFFDKQLSPYRTSIKAGVETRTLKRSRGSLARSSV